LGPDLVNNFSGPGRFMERSFCGAPHATFCPA